MIIDSEEGEGELKVLNEVEIEKIRGRGLFPEGETLL